MIAVTCYCDGSCDYRSKLGGAGVYIVTDDGIKEWYFSKGYKGTTISRMEGMALFTALQHLDPCQAILAHIYSDSQYITKAFTDGRLTKWEMIGWHDIKNVDMWKAIIREIKFHPLLKLKFNHIRGHQEDVTNDHVFGNNVADALANYKIHKIYHEDSFV